MQTQLPFSHDHITPVVKNGWITIEGDAEWNFQRERAEAAVRHVRGVKGVINMIVVKPHGPPPEIKTRIEDALKRSAEVDAGRITVETDGGQGDPARQGQILGRAPGSRARCLAGARRDRGGEQDQCRTA